MTTWTTFVGDNVNQVLFRWLTGDINQNVQRNVNGNGFMEREQEMLN